MRHTISFGAFTLFFLAAIAFTAPPAGAQATTLFNATSSALVAYSRLPEMEGAAQFGYGAAIGFAVFGGRDESARQDTEPASSRPAWMLLIEGSVFSYGQSRILADFSSYRAWEGFGAGLLNGIEIPLFGDSGFRLTAAAGFGLRAARYTSTSLVTAYPAILGRIGGGMDIAQGLRVLAELPLELAFRSGGLSVSTGLSFGVSARGPTFAGRVP